MRKKYFLAALVAVMAVIVIKPGLLALAVDSSGELKLQVESLILQVEKLQKDINTAKGGEAVTNTTKPPVFSNTLPIAPTPSGFKFSKQQRVRATDYLNVRESVKGVSFGTVSPGTRGTIAEGPVEYNGYLWWSVVYDNKVAGWSAENWLTYADDSSPTSPFSSTSNPPVFSESALISPTSVGVGDSNWWRIQATDPEKSDVTFTIDWGDGSYDTYTLKSGGDRAAYHIYKKIGTYKISARAADSGGASSVRFLTVEVLDSATLVRSNKFKTGDLVRTLDYLNVRTGPSGVWVATKKPGATGKITGGPVWSIIGKWWWGVRYDDGVSGWSAEDWLEKVGGGLSRFICGDADLDGDVDRDDVERLNSYAFRGLAIPKEAQVDLNGDGVVNVFDVTALTDYTYRNGPAPTCKPGFAVSDFVCGDVNKDRTINFSDVEVLGDYVFRGKPISDMNLVDLNRDGQANVFDMTILVDHVNRGGPAPTCTPAATPITPEIPPPTTYACGDVDGDGDIDLSDVDGLNNFVFRNAAPPAGQTDVNADGTPDVFDVTSLNAYVQGRGLMPTCGKPARTYSCGDINLDGKIDLLDEKYLQFFLFSGGTLPQGINVDFSGDGKVDVLDMVRLVDHVERGGAAPVCASSGGGGGGGGGGGAPGGTRTGASVMDAFINFFRSLW